MKKKNFSVESQSNDQLLSTVLGVKVEGVVSLSDLLRSPRSISSVGEKRENKLYAVQEITRRLLKEASAVYDTISCPDDAAEILMPTLRYETQEHFVILILNTKNHVIKIHNVTTGSISSTIVHPREVFRETLKYPAASIILAHNHPSGDPQPSSEDIETTKRLVKAGNILDIPVLDHIIIGDNRWTSLKERGLM